MMALLKSIGFIVLAILVIPKALATGASSDLSGYWEGSITYKSEDLPFRISVEGQGQDQTAKLDLPSLIYAGQPLDILEGAGGAYVLTFPFGIGALEVKADGPNSWSGGNEKIALLMNRTAPAPYKKVEIEFGHSEIKLAGTVYIPDGGDAYPAVILVAGSGNATRSSWSYASWADFYARRGYAALIFDRRSDFELTEDGEIMGFDDHGRDIVEALEHLQRVPGIDPGQIGIAGHSRGSWLALAAANQFEDVSFLILGSLAVSTPAEQEAASILTGMDQDGVSAQDMTAARSYLRLYFYVAETGKGWPLLEAAMKDAQGSIWFQYVDQPRSLDDLRWWKANMNFDARGVLRKISIPVLTFWGGNDFISPWRNYSEHFAFDTRQGGNGNNEFRIFEGADHRIEISMGERPDGSWQWFGMAPGLFETIESWLKEVTF